MDDQDTSNSPTPRPDDRRRSLGPVRSLARRGRRRVSNAVRARLDDAAEILRRQMLDWMSSPDQVKALQQGLVRLTGWTLSKGFQADPNAELLFHFVDWLEKRHGRPQVMAILMRSEMLRDPTFIDALLYLSRSLSPWTTEVEEPWDQHRVERFKERAAHKLLDLLVALVALESDRSPPRSPISSQADVAERVEYFEAAPLPARFTRLAAMTQGDLLLRRDTTSRSRKWAQKALKRVGPAPKDSALAKFIPGLGDETLHFLVFSTTFFLQSYLLRNLVEALPELADEFTQAIRDDDAIDLQ